MNESVQVIPIYPIFPDLRMNIKEYIQCNLMLKDQGPRTKDKGNTRPQNDVSRWPRRQSKPNALYTAESSQTAPSHRRAWVQFSIYHLTIHLLSNSSWWIALRSDCQWNHSNLPSVNYEVSLFAQHAHSWTVNGSSQSHWLLATIST